MSALITERGRLYPVGVHVRFQDVAGDWWVTQAGEYPFDAHIQLECVTTKASAQAIGQMWLTAQRPALPERKRLSLGQRLRLFWREVRG